MKGSKILIVEDERIVAEDIRKTLDRLGYRVSAIASSGEGAIKNIEHETPDLVLMDIMLKGKMEGTRIAEVIRSRFTIPVVYLTAYADQKILEEAKMTGPYGYIVKPFTEAELFTTIEIALYKHTLEMRLRESEEKFRDLFESANDMIIIVDKDGAVIDANCRTEELTGFTHEELVSSNIFLDLLVPEDRNIISDLMHDHIAAKRKRYEVRLKAKNGHTMIFEGSSSLRLSKAGTFLSMQCILRDITERKQAETMLKLLKEAVESLPIGITISTIEGKIVYVNPAEANIHGYSVEELVGKDSKIFAPMEFWKPIKFEEIHGMGVWRRESINIRKTGETFPVKLTSVAVKNAEGTPIGVIMACEDITEQKQAEEELVRRQEALHSVYKMAITLGSSFQAVCDEVVLSLSELLKTSHVIVQRMEEGKFKTISSIADGKLNSEEIHSLADFHCACLSDKKEVYKYTGMLHDYIKDFPHMDHDLKSIVCVPVIETTGEVVGSIIALDRKERDYTNGEVRLIEIFARYVAFEIQREEMNARLRDAQKMEVIGKLAGGVAHEVRNPLNAILVITEALFKDLGDNKEYRPFLFHIRSQVNRLSSLMKDLLDLGKPVEQAHMQQESLNKICSSSLDIWKHSELSRSYKVEMLQPSDTGDIFVLADSQRLQQVFLNLLDNAAHHSPGGSEIQLVIEPVNSNMCKVRVIDQGSGVPEEILPRIFEPFFSTRRGGTGLGLSIVKYVVETHGGNIVIFNNAPPPGCTVEVRLPISEKHRS
jgi:PAS domain S-box-containing protein